MAPFRLDLATTLVLLLAVPFLHPTMVAGEANPASSAIQGPPKKEEDPASAYRTYIVSMSPPADAAAMSRGELRRWHESLLPSLLTESGQKRLVCSYSAVFHGFAARLTEAELAAVAKLPGFVRALPDRKRYLQATFVTRAQQGRQARLPSPSSTASRSHRPGGTGPARARI
ncbi:unnamed protein product [Urochloa humidicola]